MKKLDMTSKLCKLFILGISISNNIIFCCYSSNAGNWSSIGQKDIHSSFLSVEAICDKPPALLNSYIEELPVFLDMNITVRCWTGHVIDQETKATQQRATCQKDHSFRPSPVPCESMTSAPDLSPCTYLHFDLLTWALIEPIHSWLFYQFVSSMTDYLLVEVTCGDPGEGTNVWRREGNDFSFADSVTFLCPVGHVVKGTSESLLTMNCTETGQWSHDPPTCEREYQSPVGQAGCWSASTISQLANRCRYRLRRPWTRQLSREVHLHWLQVPVNRKFAHKVLHANPSEAVICADQYSVWHTRWLTSVTHYMDSLET